MIKPSLIGLVISGLLIGFALIVLFNNLNSDELKSVRLVNLLLFLSTSIGIHSILHILAEKHYNFKPFEIIFNK